MQAGISQAWRLLRLSPREIEMEMQAHLRRRQIEAEQADLAAWLAGRYVLMAVHAPKRFPRSPDGVRRQNPSMSDDAMKQAFIRIAASRGDTNGDC